MLVGCRRLQQILQSKNISQRSRSLKRESTARQHGMHTSMRYESLVCGNLGQVALSLCVGLSTSLERMSSPLGEFAGRPVFKLLTMTSLSGKSPKDAPCSIYLWLRHFSFVSEYNLGHLQEEPADNWGGLIMHPSRHKKRVGTARIMRSAVATQPWLDRGAVLSLF
jgi:hypothetical protein